MNKKNDQIEVTKQPKGDHILQAIHGSPDHPLRIGDIEIPCYVLEDGKRILVQSGMLLSLDMSQGTAGRGRGDRLTKFIDTKSIKPFVNESLVKAIESPIRFKTPTGQDAYGYEATILADLCDVVLDARKSPDVKMNYQQQHIAERCEILMRGFARVGIVALVDEATGYQDFRAREALEKILEKFISEELLKWVKRFPDEFYKEMFRLRDWEYKANSVKRPSVVGTLTNDVVYSRLAPGVLEELKRLTPKDEKGRLKHHLHRRLTLDIGHPKLQEHLAAVIALMKASPDWRTFERLINRALPKYEENYTLPMFDEEGLPM